VKPENILLVKSPNGLVPKVIDFGIARVLDEHGESLSKTVGAMPGTPLYMSPEHARGQKDLDGRADVWSLGVVLYVLLTGRQPFFGDSVRQVVWKVLHESPPPIWDLAHHLPPCVCELVHTALEHDPARRYATMRDFHAAAERCVAELKKPPPAPVPSERPAPRPDARVWAPRLAFVAALLFAASVGFALTLPRSRRGNVAAGGAIRRPEVIATTTADIGRSSPRMTTTVLALVSDAAVVEKPVTPPPRPPTRRTTNVPLN
jgi:serine/threonine protein kinase